MRSRPEAGSTDQDWGEKRAQNMVTVDNDSAKQAVLRSVDEIFNVRRIYPSINQSVFCYTFQFDVSLQMEFTDHLLD